MKCLCNRHATVLPLSFSLFDKIEAVDKHVEKTGITHGVGG